MHMAVTNITNSTNATVYYCQYGIISSSPIKTNWSIGAVVNGSNATQQCYYCNVTTQTKGYYNGNVDINIAIANWLRFSSLPPEVLDELGWTGVAYGVLVLYNYTTSSLSTNALATAIIAVAGGITAYYVGRKRPKAKEELK